MRDKEIRAEVERVEGSLASSARKPSSRLRRYLSVSLTDLPLEPGSAKTKVEYTFDLFVALAILETHRAQFLGCQDVIALYDLCNKLATETAANCADTPQVYRRNEPSRRAVQGRGPLLRVLPQVCERARPGCGVQAVRPNAPYRLHSQSRKRGADEQLAERLELARPADLLALQRHLDHVEVGIQVVYLV